MIYSLRVLEYKALSLYESYIELKKGNYEESSRLLVDVYNSPKNDESKVRAIIGIIFCLKINNPDENEKILVLSEEAIEIASELNIVCLREYTRIFKNEAILYNIIDRISEILIGLEIQNHNKEQLFSFFYTQELVELNSFRESIINEINNSLKVLLEEKDFYYYIASLSTIIDIITMQIMWFSCFNKDIVNQEKQTQRILIKEAEFIIENVKELDLRKSLLKSLASYYYCTLEIDKAKEYMIKALEIVEEDKDIYSTNSCKSLLEIMTERPNPYEVPEPKPLDEKTVEEYQEVTRMLLEAQGVKFDGTDYLTELIVMALRDMNPKDYFKHCENIHIAYVNTSPVGASIGLPSMGMKLVWCKHAKNSIASLDLNGLFNSFIKENCKDCKLHKPRSEEWICKVKWVYEQQNNPDFKKVLDNFKNRDSVL